MTMKRTLLALIALTALAAACHEQRQDDDSTRAAAGDSQLELQRQTPPPASQAY
jgi:nitrous oxide reductase accessory protein NosL